MKRMILILMMALGGLSACVETIPSAPSAAPGNAIETAVVQTLTAMPTSTLPPSPTTIPATATALPIATTAIPPSPTPTVVLPTPTATPVPTAVYQSSGGGVYYAPVTEDPAAFIRYYYGQINLGNYPLTWSLLDTNFINNNNGPATGGYTGYVDFWSTVHEVIVQSVYVDSQSGYYAVVTVTSMYKWVSGLITYSTDTFNLIYNSSRATWMFDSPYQSYVPYYYPPVYYTAQTPYQFILYYFSQINQGNYALTWSLLDTNFINQNNNASQGGYASYVAYWDTITNVSVQSVYVLSQGTYTATVSVYAIYTKTTGVVAGYTSTFNLIYDTTRSSWLFDS
jgi:hypothetical protein